MQEESSTPPEQGSATRNTPNIKQKIKQLLEKLIQYIQNAHEGKLPKELMQYMKNSTGEQLLKKLMQYMQQDREKLLVDLVDSIKNNNISQFVELLTFTDSMQLVNCKMEMGDTLLLVAIKHADENKVAEFVRILLKMDANPNTYNDEYVTPLRLAVKQKYVDVVTVLLNHPGTVDYEAGSILSSLAIYDTKIYKLLQHHSQAVLPLQFMAANKACKPNSQDIPVGEPAKQQLPPSLDKYMQGLRNFYKLQQRKGMMNNAKITTAVCNNDHRKLEELLGSHAYYDDSSTFAIDCPLYTACENGKSLEVVKLLMKYGMIHPEYTTAKLRGVAQKNDHQHIVDFLSYRYIKRIYMLLLYENKNKPTAQNQTQVKIEHKPLPGLTS